MLLRLESFFSKDKTIKIIKCEQKHLSYINVKFNLINL